jgi:2-polyprenyl-3-methyl-5-hydroxy-6-metoxy-1,4-benzoquinol methylase
MIDTEKLLIALEDIKKLLLEIKNKQETIEIQSTDFDALKKELIGDSWPVAVPSELICNAASEQDKADRANNILSMFVPRSPENLKFLDFGCGEGHVAKEAAMRKANLSVGYDIKQQGELAWNERNDNFLLTPNFTEAKELGPYDIILMYDVLDHCDEPENLLKQVKELSKPTTTIYIRCHPWCSRHGGHLYNQMNKAWVHLIFTPEELASLGLTPPNPSQRVLFPIGTYKQYFQRVGLKFDEPDIQRTEIEDFFKTNNIVSNRLSKTFAIKNFPEWQMTQGFLDYVVSPL